MDIVNLVSIIIIIKIFLAATPPSPTEASKIIKLVYIIPYIAVHFNNKLDIYGLFILFRLYYNATITGILKLPG